MAIDFDEALATAKYDPTAMINAGCEYLRKKTNGEVVITNAMNPLLVSMEFAATAAANGIKHIESKMRKLYPKLAVTADDIYYHMADTDYPKIFTMPSWGTFDILIPIDEIKNSAVADSNNPNVKKLLIPRNTEIILEDITFTLLYPIEIIVTEYGNLNILYDNSIEHELFPLSSNMVPWVYTTALYKKNYVSCIKMTLKLPQLKRVRMKSDSLTSESVYTEYKVLDDYYTYAISYVRDATGTRGIYSTHSDYVYDQNKMTVCYRLLDNVFKVNLPIVYSRQINTTMIILTDIYQTRGDITINLEEYVDYNKIVAQTPKEDITVEESKYLAPIENLKSLEILPRGYTTGGSEPLDFAKLRDLVINRSEYVEAPIISAAITNNAMVEGYQIVKSIDHLTDRIYLATRYLDDIIIKDTVTNAATCIGTLVASLDAIRANKTVYDNGDCITISPDTLFTNNNGIVSVVPYDDIPDSKLMSPDLYLKIINESNFAYSPFYYFLDTRNNIFDVKIFHLDDPTTDSIQFVNDNKSTQLSINIAAAELVRSNFGYKLYLTTTTSETYQKLDIDNLFAQLFYIPTDELNNTYLNGRPIGIKDKGIVWEFELITNLLFTNQNEIVWKNFKMFTETDRDFSSPLSGRFNVLFGVKNYKVNNYTKNVVDGLIGTHLFDDPSNLVGISINSLELKFGKHLKYLWSGTQSVPSEIVYDKYTVNVPDTYSEDVYAIDEKTKLPIREMDEFGILRLKTLHKAGDPKLDALGKPVIKYYAGDNKRDVDGKLIPLSGRVVERTVELFLIDGINYFATNSNDVDYREAIPRMTVNMIEKYVEPMNDRLLENTHLYFVPKNTMGLIDVITDNSIERRLPAKLQFNIDYYLTDEGYKDDNLKSTITKITSVVINKLLKENTVTKDGIERKLKEDGGDQIVSVSINGIGGNMIVSATALENDARFSVNRRLRRYSDGSLKVEEDIVINYFNHHKQDYDKV